MTMKTFRKEQGGYALLSVAVVVSVVCAIVMLISASAVKNYQSQQDSVAQMQAKYAAMGEVEKILAQIKGTTGTDGDSFEDAIKTLNVSCVCEIETDEETAKTFAEVTLTHADIQVMLTAELTQDTSDPTLWEMGEPTITVYEIGGAA
ncbi:MAG: hypothetical protein IJE22_02715 [Oscillibacter sp.]|nr:hypothetical protein [Oscillibacter sp.]